MLGTFIIFMTSNKINKIRPMTLDINPIIVAVQSLLDRLS